MVKKLVFKDEMEMASFLGLSAFDVAIAKEKGRISRLLRTARLKANVTQRDLATLVGSSPSAIARLEAGDNVSVSLEYLLKVATALEVPVLIRSTTLIA